MTKVRPTTTPGVPILGPIFNFVVLGPGRRLAPLWVVGLVLTVGGYWGWNEYQAQIAADPLYHVTLESIAVTPTPAWIKTDVKIEALRDASIDFPVSALDDQLAERIAKAFTFHPWVESVAQVRKRPPAAIEVDLRYRRPVCMVELPEKSGLYAVDAAAVLLPSRDFLDDPKSTTGYPRLSGVTAVSVGRVGAVWADPLVTGGATIAALIEPHWSELNLLRIIPLDGTVGVPAGPQFELITRPGSRLVWGSPPGHEMSGEMTAAQKLVELRRYADDHGGLEGPQGPQRLDLRGGHITVLADNDAKSKSGPDASAAKPAPERRK